MTAVRAALIGLACLMVLGSASRASAHPIVDEARRLLLEAEFDAALAALDRAEAAADLTRAEVVLLLETRALIYAGRAQQVEMERVLDALASLAPTHQFAPEVPPALRRQFVRLVSSRAGPLAIHAVTRETEDGVEITGRAENDAVGLVRGVRVSARVGGRVEVGRGSLRLAIDEGARVEYFVEAIGPGGAVIASDGDAQEPLLMTRSGAGGAVGAGALGATGDDDDEAAGVPWLWIGVGAAALVAVVVLTVVLVSSGGGGEQIVTGPILDDPLREAREPLLEW
jgi:hypothetical protein